MIEYANKDHNKKILKRGFYRSLHSERIYYFHGEYNEKGFPIIEKEGKIIEDTSILESLVKRLKRINLKKMEQTAYKLRERLNWLEGTLRNDKIEELINKNRKAYEEGD